MADEGALPVVCIGRGPRRQKPASTQAKKETPANLEIPATVEIRTEAEISESVQ
jgi:hypothetical protein